MYSTKSRDNFAVSAVFGDDLPVHYVWAFLAVTIPLVLMPGASTAVVLRNSIAGGVRAGVETAVGVNAGSVVYGVLSAFGVALALQRWPNAWMLLRGAGVLYLSWLGIQSLVRAFRPSARSAAAAPRSVATSPDERDPVRNFREGFLTNALNPAIATFYFVIVPQFVPRDAPIVRTVLTLTAVHVALAVSWHIVWASAGGTLARMLGASRPRRVLEAITGIALLALAIATAV
jgi:threonine/homoserine/homoserine lactone efflux protein